MRVFRGVVAILLSLVVLSRAGAAETAPPTTLPAVTITVTDKSWPSSPGFHFMRLTAHAGTKSIPMDTGIFLPKAFFQSTQAMPIVMTLHNRGNSGAGGGM